MLDALPLPMSISVNVGSSLTLPEACNGTIIGDEDSKMGDVIQLQGDQRAKIKDFLTNKDEGLGLDAKTIKVHGF